jgi:glutamate synthase (NADPH/NADH) large chain
MGNDLPPAVLSHKNKTLYHYFQQLFAQVTNPPIADSREPVTRSSPSSAPSPTC